MKQPNYIELKVPGRLRKVGFLFDMYAWFLLYQEMGTDLNDISGNDPEKLMGDMIYTSAVSACKEKGRRVRFNRDKVMGWLDKMTNRDVKELGKVFNESITLLNKTIEATDGATNEKKN